MSRVGRLPVALPQGVTVTVDSNNVVTVKGSKGTLTKGMSKQINIAVEDSQVVVTRPNDEKEVRSLHGLTRALINNMVVGVSEGYKKTLDLVGVGYKVAKQGKKIVLNVGYSHPVEIEEVEGITLDVPGPNQIIVNGIDKELVGHISANIRSVRPPEPYKGKGIKYADEVVRRKEGKTGKK
ncbi:50S ribosomal protein L6 [Clostridium cylindrosporum]|uniref:Large ribosomal subunit protein uL6 n=1 Tax=Clostridium cylindrosporum DSM 605 TaxID=1121307 RepID=A0A0J8D4Y5_CLOCY|nr:50S ribosomal protein L6 [Clostridium cylindrosporum]KMT21225.1 50S ribosomal protein L6 [Clostridium cylindrosporum DSM 605]